MSAVNSSTSVQSASIQSLSQIVATHKQLKAQSQSDAQVTFRPVQTQDTVEISDEAREAFKNIKANVFGSSVTEGESVGSVTNDQETAMNPLVSNVALTKAQESIIKSILQSAIPQTQPNTANTAMPDPMDSFVIGGTITQNQEANINVAFEAAKKAYLH